jgi:hypothetical protein
MAVPTLTCGSEIWTKRKLETKTENCRNEIFEECKRYTRKNPTINTKLWNQIFLIEIIKF